MITMKDIAKRAGVSGTTVSIILNGKAEERHISPATKDKVLALCAELGYQPNLSARRLRSQEKARPVIAFYWPLDHRTHILASFLTVVQETTSARGFDCEIAIRTYQNDLLQDSIAPLLNNSYTGVLIGAASQKDLDYLESVNPSVPVVLINRHSEKYSTVSIDEEVIGTTIATLFRQKGYMNVTSFIADRAYMATGLRTQAFFRACERIGISILPEYILRTENSISGGVAAAQDYLQMKDAPTAIYCESDIVALGVVSQLQKEGLRFPQDHELICIDMSDPDYTKYFNPPISTIQMDNQQVLESAVDILIHSIEHADLSPQHVTIEPEVHLRSTFQLPDVLSH